MHSTPKAPHLPSPRAAGGGRLQTSANRGQPDDERQPQRSEPTNIAGRWGAEGGFDAGLENWKALQREVVDPEPPAWTQDAIGVGDHPVQLLPVVHADSGN